MWSTVIIFMHPIASYFIWISSAWHVSRTVFGTVLSTVNIFIHQTACCIICRSAAWNIGRTALGTILSTVVLFMHHMCHDHDAHVFSTTIRQKKQERFCQKKQDGLCRKKGGKTTETRRKGTCMEKKKEWSKKREIQTTLDTTEAKKASAISGHRSCSPSSAWSSRPCQCGGSYGIRFKQIDRSALVRFLV